MSIKIRLIVATVTMLLIFGCSGKAPVKPETGKPSGHSETQPPSGKDSGNVKYILLKEFKKWEGTPHKMGGNSKRGIDCSGFAYYMYSTLFHLDVPRTTKQYTYAGVQIKKAELRPGDLVVFRPPSYPRHVGIYVGNNQFIHASTSKGVMKSDLGNPYWKKSYWMSRRILK